MCKVFVSTLTMRADSSKNENAVQRVNEIFEELNIPLVKYFNLFRKHLGIIFNMDNKTLSLKCERSFS